MKYMTTIVFMFFITTSYAQMQDMNMNRPTFGNQVPNRGTTTGNVRDGSVREDTVGTGQSSTIRSSNNGASPRTMNSNPPTSRIFPNDPAYCTDTTGRRFVQGDTDYRNCVDSMNRMNRNSQGR
ncbi:hypothetical protein DOM21_13305 [Bacteriovorax stolpii]|uniref:hypothetical protein n=1 Tax=Bacteriovorax stolpii TaxID=960 RepID=UPI001159CCE5|nr:hypothetical protein [Bacteriovorax stolpii]QDK42404.1 hypothetical protein DOM21_13305 [Bacteriovorax stolpii]